MLVSRNGVGVCAFISTGAINFWAEGFLVVGDCPVHYRIFSNAHGLDPPDVNSTPTSCDKQKWSLDIAKYPLGQNCSQFSTIAVRVIQATWIIELGRNGTCKTPSSANKILRLAFHGLSLCPHCILVTANRYVSLGRERERGSDQPTYRILCDLVLCSSANLSERGHWSVTGESGSMVPVSWLIYEHLETCRIFCTYLENRSLKQHSLHCL